MPSMYELFGRSRSEVLADQDIKQAKLMSRRSLAGSRRNLRQANGGFARAESEYLAAIQRWTSEGSPIEGELYEATMAAYDKLCVAQGAVRTEEFMVETAAERDSKLRRYL